MLFLYLRSEGFHIHANYTSFPFVLPADDIGSLSGVAPTYLSHASVHVVAIRASRDLCKMDKVSYEDAVAQLARMNLMKTRCGCFPETRRQIIALNAAPWERWNMLELELRPPVRFEFAPIVRSRMVRKWTVGSDILALGVRTTQSQRSYGSGLGETAAHCFALSY